MATHHSVCNPEPEERRVRRDTARKLAQHVRMRDQVEQREEGAGWLLHAQQAQERPLPDRRAHAEVKELVLSPTKVPRQTGHHLVS